MRRRLKIAIGKNAAKTSSESVTVALKKATAELRNGLEWDGQQHKYVPKQSVESDKSDFQAIINVSIHADRGEIQLPKTPIPPLHGDSDHGWWNIRPLHNDAELPLTPRRLLEPGDRIGVMAPRDSFPALRQLFGDSVRELAKSATSASALASRWDRRSAPCTGRCHCWAICP